METTTLERAARAEKHLLTPTRLYPVSPSTTSGMIHTIFEGTSEIQQLVIARAISGLRIE